VIALFRTEFVKAVRRGRTLVIVGVLVGLPVLVSVAIKSRGPRRDRGEGLFRLAQQSGVLVPAAVLSVMSGFLLVVVAGLFAGDAVAGDAASGNLRYLLMRPVRRSRLLIAKASVAGLLIWLTIVVVTVGSLVVGVVLFGSHPVDVPAGATGVASAAFRLGTSTVLVRVLIAAAYIAFGYTALMGLGTLFSTSTDSPTGAIGATVGVYIVSAILDSITQIGRIRYALPTHYLDAWVPMLTQNRYPHDMIVGIAVQVAYMVVFGAASLWWFGRKDIRC
jgi:ABC-2 type transport system permease protein